MKNYKSVKGLLKALSAIAYHNEIAELKGFNKLNSAAQGELYATIAGLQNDLHEFALAQGIHDIENFN